MPARILTATPLCDGHDASIALVTRLLREAGLEVIYLGFNRSVEAIVKSALEEDVAAVALSSYNGGHMSFFTAVREELNAAGGSHILLYGGGGGTITASEAILLEKAGFKKIFRPGGNIQQDVASIAHDLEPFNRVTPPTFGTASAVNGKIRALEIGRGVHCRIQGVPFDFHPAQKAAHTVLLTGRGGSGKSTLLDELLRILLAIPDLKIGVLSIDPTFGDRLRMTVTDHPRVFVHSAPAGETGWPEHLPETVAFLSQCGFDLVLIESSGTGQVVRVPVTVDLHVHMMTPDYGTRVQLEKESLLKAAEVVVLNKSDYAGASTRFKELQGHLKSKLCVATSAAQHNHSGTLQLAKLLAERFGFDATHLPLAGSNADTLLVPAARRNYLADIGAVIDQYHQQTEADVKRARSDGEFGQAVTARWEALAKTRVYGGPHEGAGTEGVAIGPDEIQLRQGERSVAVERKTYTGLWLPVIAMPECDEPGAMVRFLRTENVPGEFPYTGGVFHYRNREEDPIRMFAGLGTAADTNRRFHFLSHGARSVRLSTAFDSLTLYGLDSDHPGAECKVGEGGVAISTIDDMLQLYEGFDLNQCSVSMTINGPAPTLLAMYVVAAKRRGFTSQKLRGTVQADILKEIQAQNEALFPIGAHMRMIADMIDFTNREMPLWYPISISGYHIGEAGANPIEELAFTLANGFTYVEYLAARGLDINKFAPRLSFFFTSGSDVEFNVMGRVARRVWAIAMQERYHGDPRSQKLKYHTQTSGRTLVERDALANLCRVTLQAHRALVNNTNSLHTNSYKEAYSTPAEDDAHLAIGCQEIPLHEFGDFKFTENLLQGSYGLNALTARVEQAVLAIFREIDREGGVDKAIEHQYHRLRIQSSSKQYEEEVAAKKRPIFGVNFRVNPYSVPPESGLVRTSLASQRDQVERVRAFKKKHDAEAKTALARLRQVAENDKANLFEELIKTVEVATVGQITDALTEVWGPFRRSM
ncbi:MAG: methylmalonyl-CoA mutase family protein [Planctomycetota bacterium]